VYNHPKEIFTSIDLEMNDSPNRTIIQIGAVVGNIHTGEILDKLSVYINPEEFISEYITNLTGIKQYDVDGGCSLQEGYEQLAAMHRRYDSFCNNLEWGCGDHLALRGQLDINDGNDLGSWCFGRRWIDVKALYVSWRFANKENHQGGLKSSCRKAGVKFEGPAHDAALDALNTFRIFCGLLSKFNR